MIANIIVLTVNSEDDIFDMYFTETEKAIDFINNNFSYDNVKKITPDYFEGTKNTYTINSNAVNQIRFY